MYFVVQCKDDPNKKFVIPIQWISNLKMSRVLNYGINKNKSYLMFCSPNEKEEPNFSLKTISQPGQIDCCFIGNILAGYGKNYWCIGIKCLNIHVASLTEGTKLKAFKSVYGADKEPEQSLTTELTKVTFKSEFNFLSTKILELKSMLDSSTVLCGNMSSIGHVGAASDGIGLNIEFEQNALIETSSIDVSTVENSNNNDGANPDKSQPVENVMSELAFDDLLIGENINDGKDDANTNKDQSEPNMVSATASIDVPITANIAILDNLSIAVPNTDNNQFEQNTLIVTPSIDVPTAENSNDNDYVSVDKSQPEENFMPKLAFYDESIGESGNNNKDDANMNTNEFEPNTMSETASIDVPMDIISGSIPFKENVSDNTYFLNLHVFDKSFYFLLLECYAHVSP